MVSVRTRRRGVTTLVSAKRRSDADYAVGPFHPVGQFLGLIGAEKLVGKEPGGPLARSEARFDEPPRAGRRLDCRACDGFDGEAAVELRIGDEPGERRSVVGNCDQPEPSGSVGGLYRPHGFAGRHTRLGPLPVPIGL